jgi:FkbM family methyltransferase
VEHLPLPRPLFMRILASVFRSIPAGMRGKSRLAHAILPRSARSVPAFIRNADGNGMVIPNLLEPVGLSLWMDGVYEPETLTFLKRHVSSTAVFVDVGANIGAFSIALARYAERVIAIEPSPQVLPFLTRNVALNGLSNVEIAPCAASLPDSDSVPLYIPPESHFGMASSAPQFDMAPTGVPAGSLDAILLEHGVGRVSVMKIDTEGYEAHVFLGARELLRGDSPPPLVFEFCDWAEERAFPGRKGWAQEILLDAGYTLWTISDYLKDRPPLNGPLTQGSHSIVGIPTPKHG